MVDQPDKQASTPDPEEPRAEQKADSSSTGGLAGWHEPPIEEGSSRPVVVEQWFTPDNAVSPDTDEGTAATGDAAALPGVAPAQTGSWYSPLDAKLDALFSGADETINEVYDSSPATPPASAVQATPLPVPSAQSTEPPQAAAQPIQAASAEPQPEESWSAPAAEEDAAVPVEAAQEPAAEAVSAEENAPEEDKDQTFILSGTQPAPAITAEAAGEEPAESELGAAESTPPPSATPVKLSDSLAAADSQSAPVAGPESVSAAQAAADAEAAQQAAPFEDVERKVAALRERYRAGELTRDELQRELRSLMILGDDGRWWMLGLETDRWYYYDGKSWTESLPPGYAERVKGSALRTETGVQEVVQPEGSSAGDLTNEASAAEISVEDEEQPLPRRVPQEDPSATLVSPNTPFMEPVRPAEARTLSSAREVGEDLQSPLPDQAVNPDGVTLRTQPVGAEPTIARGLPGGAQVASGVSAAAAAPAAQAQPAPKPRARINEYPQPDYRLALGSPRNRNFYVKWGVRITVFSIIGGMALTLLALVGMIGYYLYKVDQYAPVVASLRDRASTFENTLILDSQGATLAEFNNPDTGLRKEVALDQISPWLIDATVATENETFYTDPGFSVFAILRATYQNVTAGSTVSGASTITQQLARALVLDTELASQQTAERKVIEIIVASEIKRKYTKNEILQIYLNEIFYGNYAYGIEAAAQTYFNKSAADLNPAEAAFLAGLPQSPATYDPVVNREAALRRMHIVLDLMAEANGNGCIYIQHDDATSWAVPNGGGLCITRQDQPDGSKLYFYQTPTMEAPQEMTLDIAQVEIRKYQPPSVEYVHPHFVNYVWQQLEQTYGAQKIYNAGFHVYTSLDENIQASAEQAVTNHLASLQSQGIDATNASVVVIRPTDGAVLAMVGSADYYNKNIDGQVNIAFTAQQPGSSIKPFVYLSAFMPDDQGRYLTPASVLWDVRTDFNGYVPVNYDRLYHGPETVRSALGNSLNVPAVKALNFEGLLRFTQVAESVGLTFPLGNPVERQAGLPTALGAVEVQLFDMVTGYAMFANNGVQVEPYSIIYIEDSKGNEIYRANPNAARPQVVPPEYAYLITNILSDRDARAAEFGYGYPMELQNGRPAAIKTGTSNDSRDVWTLGYTPQIAVGVWVGNSDNRPMGNVTGYYGAAPIWNAVMESALAGQPAQAFQTPANIVQAEVCDDSGAAPSPQCAGRTHVEIFAASAPPPPADQDILRTLQVDEYTGKLVNQYCPDDVENRTFLAVDDTSAYDWLNNTAEGNAWLTQRNIAVPVMPPPTEYCAATDQRPYVVISTPIQDSMVTGVIEMRGTISMPDFSRFEIRYGIGTDPQAFSDPLIVDAAQHPEQNGLLGQLDTRVLQNGQYTLRLIAIDIYGRHVTRDVRITVNNPQSSPQTLPTPTLAPTLTVPGQAFATPPPAGVVSLSTPALAPTFTPTWTLTPTPG